jgi:hypothetical protein
LHAAFLCSLEVCLWLALRGRLLFALFEIGDQDAAADQKKREKIL